MKLSGRSYKKIVVKVGSSLMCPEKGRFDADFIRDFVAQVAHLQNKGIEVVVVSSGAIALGMSVLKMESRPKELASLQAVAAVGQHTLMDYYCRFLKEKGLNCGQLLLTWEDFNNRKRYLNAKNTLTAILKLKTIPVVNENDTVSTDEIKFGDNDRLSALVATLINADLLVILSDVDGLLDKDKKSVIRVVDRITAEIKSVACPSIRKTCVGGMITKLDAAKIAVDSGIPCVIANGRKKGILLSITKDPCASGTIFLPQREYLGAKERWIAFGAKVKGKIIVDDGAKEALRNKKSLLSVGILSCEGNFASGDIVSLVDRQRIEFARGKARLSCCELENVKGSRHDKEIIHRDNIVIF